MPAATRAESFPQLAIKLRCSEDMSRGQRSVTELEFVLRSWFGMQGPPDMPVGYEVRVYSMLHDSLGTVLAAKAIRAAHCLTSIQFSPSSEHLLLAYGRCACALLPVQLHHLFIFNFFPRIVLAVPPPPRLRLVRLYPPPSAIFLIF